MNQRERRPQHERREPPADDGFFVWLLMLDRRLSGADGGLMIALLIAYIFVSVRWSPGDSAETGSGEGTRKEMRIAWAIPGVAAASVGLTFGADLLVENAVAVAREIGLSERAISATMIAVGTSIPELTTSVIAAIRKETDISIGNIMGSNVFNIGFVLGITAVTRPVQVNPLALGFDIFWMAGVAVLLPVMILLPGRSLISRWKGLAMLSLYLVYLYLVLHQPIPR